MAPHRLPPHIARINYPRFFASAFGGIRPARNFYESLAGDGEGSRKHRALLIINQTARMLWLADRVRRVSRGRPALQIMFFIFAAEAIAKLFENYTGEGESKRHARHFFVSVCTEQQRSRLVSICRSTILSRPTALAVADQLYKIRCDVVHRWNYYGMSLKDEVVSELRAIVLEGAAHAARTLAEA